jgi:hypothetical protein
MKTFAIVVTLLFCGVCAERTPAQTQDLGGDFMSADCNSFKGFALDNNNFSTIVKVNFFENTTLLGSVLANLPLQILGQTGPHAFSFPTPNSLRDGQVHTISARIESVGTDMADSPRTIGPCGPIGFTIPNPRITSFEISKPGSIRKEFEKLGFDATTNPNLTLRVEMDHSDRVHFYRLGEIACPESVSDRPEDRMKNLPWQSYTQGQSFSFRLDTSMSQPYGTRCVFMEVNTMQNESSASAAKGDSIILAPGNFKTFTLTGPALDSFLNRAKAVGYRFSFAGPSQTGNTGCPGGTVPDVLVGGTDFFETWTVKIFDRSSDRKLNPFWKMKDVHIRVFFQSETNKRIEFAPLSANDPFQSISIKEGYAANGSDIHQKCFAPKSDPGETRISSITLEGPGDKQPEDALFELNHPLFQLKPLPLHPQIRRP